MMKRSELEGKIRREWQTICDKSKVKVDPDLGWLPKGRIQILGSSQKVEKGEERGILTAVAYLLPGDSSGRDICPQSSPMCRSGCLGEWSGRMGFDRGVRNAQAWKTILRLGAAAYYMDLVRLDTVRIQDLARLYNMTPAIRLDGTSDLGDAFRFVEEFPNVMWYDYTKVPDRIERWQKSNWHNQHLTFSYSGQNLVYCLEFLKRGINVAVPFDVKKGEPLPAEWKGYPVFDGDIDDYRPGDPPGHVVGLRWKGPSQTRHAALDSFWLQPG